MSLEAHAESRSNQLAPPRGRFVLPGWRLLLAGPVVAVLTMAAALLTTADAGVPLRDPDNVTGNRLVLAVTLIGGLFVIDMAVRAWRRSEGRLFSWEALVAVRREHWTLHRWLAVTGAIVAFYGTYLAYRNL